MIMMMIIFTITISKRVFLCACFISSYQMLYGLHHPLGLSEIGAEGQKVQKSKLVTFFLL